MTSSILKVSAALALGVVLTASVVDTSDARNRWVGPAVGFGVGVAVGAAAANAQANAYYNDPYYGYGGYYYDPYGGYAAAPRYAYPAPGYYYNPYRPRRECLPEHVGQAGC